MAYIGNQPTSIAFLTDQFSGTGSATTFTLSVAPANTSSILVAVTGVLQDPSTYAVAGTTLTFSQAPPAGTGNISVRYLGIPASGVTTTAYRTVTEFTATAGQTLFNVPSYTVGYISVFRNGVRLGASDFTATSGTTVVLTNACTAGDLVITESFYVSSVLNAIPATNGAVNTAYIADNAITTAKISPGAVIQADLASGVAGNGPSFSAFQSSSQTLSSSTYTKIQFQSEEFDTANCFDSSTNFRFTPNVAGYYLFSTSIAVASFVTQIQLAIYKNGSIFKQGFNNTGSGQPNMSALIYMNGSTDFVEVYAWLSGGQALSPGGAPYNYFQGFLARAA